MIQAIQTKSSVDGVAWDLSDLYHGIDDPRINQDLEEARKRAQAFESTYRGKIGVPAGPDRGANANVCVTLIALCPTGLPSMSAITS